MLQHLTHTPPPAPAVPPAPVPVGAHVTTLTAAPPSNVIPIRATVDTLVGWEPRRTTADLPALVMDGTPVHLVDADAALDLIADASTRRVGRPLGVVSINLDHVHHFGTSRLAARGAVVGGDTDTVEWLNLIDGAPIADQAQRVTGTSYPKLSGSDLIEPILDDAAARHLSVGVLGGMPDVQTALRARFADEWPGVRFAGHWTPSRDDLASERKSQRIAAEIRAARVDILLVCLGKPRQEIWMNTHGAQSGARVLLAFGAVVDFLAGRLSRAPRWVSKSGMEWAWRLMLEPRRLARRYLIQGPPAYLAVRRSGA